MINKSEYKKVEYDTEKDFFPCEKCDIKDDKCACNYCCSLGVGVKLERVTK